MLHVFLVNNGTTFTFDINLAMDSVANLKLAIYQRCDIPPDQQVLLISGGERLSSSEMVYKHSSPAGTDTCPIFLFSKCIVPNVEEYNEKDEIIDRVMGCINMKPNFNTVISRTEMAQALYDADHTIYSLCEKLVLDQHLQQQGWAAVVANFDDLINSFSTNAKKAFQLYNDILKNKTIYNELFKSFEEDKKLLSRIPILKCLFPKHENYQNISMLEWILKNDNKDNLDNFFCLDQLNSFDEDKLVEMQKSVSNSLQECAEPQVREIKRLEARLSQLEKKMNEVRQLFDRQGILSKGFTQNQSRLSDLRDQSILPDLCQNHKEQLEAMLTNHEKISSLAISIQRAKHELSSVLYTRLKAIVKTQEMLHAEGKKLVACGIRLQKLRHSLEVIRNLHVAPEIYLKSIAEIRRRRMFHENYSKWAKNVCQTSKEVIDEEITNRQQFNFEFEKYVFKLLFFKTFFPGMDDLPPNFINEFNDFDQNLPQITNEDIKYLRNELPDLSEFLVLPCSVSTPPLISSPTDKLEIDQIKKIDQSIQFSSEFQQSEYNRKDVHKIDVSTETSILFHKIDEMLSTQNDLEKLLDDKQKIIESLDEQLAQRDETLVTFCTRTKEIEAINTSLLDLLRSIKSEYNDKLKQQVLHYKQELKVFSETIANLYQQERFRKNEIVESMNNKLAELTKTIGCNTNKISILQNELDDKVSEIEQLKIELEDSKRQFSEMVELINEVSQMCNVLESTSHSEIQQLLDFKSKFSSFKSHLNDSYAQIKAQLNNFQNYQFEFFKNQFDENLDFLKQVYSNKIDSIQSKMTNEKEVELQQLKDNLLLAHKMEMESMRHRYKLAITTTSIERTSSETSLEKVQLDIVDQSAQEKEIQRLNAQLSEQKNEFDDEIAKIKNEYEEKLLQIQANQNVVEAMENDLNNNDMIKNQMAVFENFYSRLSSKLSVIDVSNPDDNQCRNTLNSIIQDYTEVNRAIDGLNARSFIAIPNSQDITAPTNQLTNSVQVPSFQGDVIISYLNCSKGDKVLVYFDKKYQNYLAYTLTDSLYFIHSDYSKDTCFFSVPPDEDECVLAEVTYREYCQIKKAENRYRLPMNTQFFRLFINPIAKYKVDVNELKQNINDQSLFSPKTHQLYLSSLLSRNSTGPPTLRLATMSQSCYNFENTQ